MVILMVADEFIGGLVEVDLAQRVIDQTGRKPRVRFVCPATFELLMVCGMDIETIEVTESVFETFYLTLTDQLYVREVVSLIDLNLGRSGCSMVGEYLTARGIILSAIASFTDQGGVVSTRNNPTVLTYLFKLSRF